ncbi:MAG TPA: histidine kinase dimerization/phospho-acceptor domain-containing protein, partial [Spirochaetota bacterium]|nr:histidine kinase dimerization/phospho-acceptor domain-containing protein [Spirochaetota bacterium]
MGIFKNYIGNINISYRMQILFQSMSLGIILIFIIFLITTNLFYNLTNKILQENVTSIRSSYNLETSLLNLKGLRANFILDNNIEWINLFNDNVKKYNYWYRETVKTAMTDEEKIILQKMNRLFIDYLVIHDQIIDLANDNKKEEAVKLILEKSNNIFKDLYNYCEQLIGRNYELIDGTKRDINRYLFFSRLFGYIIISGFIIIGILFSILLTKSILTPVKEMYKDSDFLAEKSDNLINDKQDEINKLKSRFNIMIQTIKDDQKKLVETEKRSAIIEMTAGLSHEINNPIGIIYGFADRLIRSDKLSYEHKEIAKEIFNEADRCKILVGELLSFARNPEITLELSDICALVKSSVELFINQDKYNHIKFITNIATNIPKIKIDKNQIKQVLINLILNAIDSIDQSGIIEVELEKINSNISITIKDNGKGITKEIKGKIFKTLFYTKTKDVSLEIYICKD